MTAPHPDSELKQALRERDLILENAGLGIVLVKQRRIVRCNQRYAEIYGFATAQAACGISSISLYVDEAAYKQLGAEAYPVMAGGGSFKTERLMRKCDGSLFWCGLTGRLINAEDPAEGSIWIVDDIDEQKRAQAALQKVMLEQQLLFDHSMVGIVFLHDRKVVQCNRSFEQLFGYEPGELIGSSSRQWYASDEAWAEGGRRCYEPFARGEAFQGEMLLCRKDGTEVCCEVRSKAIDTHDLSRGSIWITMDISARKHAEAELVRAKLELERLVDERTAQLSRTVTELEQQVLERREAEERIQRLAHFDVLTGLPNRALLEERSAQAIGIARRRGEPLAVMFLDLDHFKKVNDSLGHRVGDELLRQLSLRLKAALRDQDTVSRLGGDEFVIVLPGSTAQGSAQAAAKIMRLATRAFQIEQNELLVTPSIGIAMFPEDGANFEALCKSADIAMYQAKRDGRNLYRFFTAEMQAMSERSLQIETALRRALESGQLSLHYQPQISLHDGRVVGAEALLRWQHPELGGVSPAEFIPIAEATGLILPMGEWVLRTALRQLKDWMDEGVAEFTMAVNLSSVQLRHADLPTLVTRQLIDTGLPPRLLELELTEGVAMADPLTAVAVMNELHDRGVRMSIDDFGTGYSSLSYLKQFRVYKLKIDRSFVRDLSQDPEDRAIIRAVIGMAASLGLQSIAEGVETEQQLAYLRAEGCDEVQGYLFSRPLPAEEFERYVRRAQAAAGGASPSS